MVYREAEKMLESILENKTETHQGPGDEDESIARYNRHHDYNILSREVEMRGTKGLAELSFLVD